MASLSIAGSGTRHLVWFNQGQAPQMLFYGRMVAGSDKSADVVGIGNPDAQAAHPAVLATEQRVLLAWKELTANSRRSACSNRPTAAKLECAAHQAAGAGQSDHPQLLRWQQRVFLIWNMAEGGLKVVELSPSSAGALSDAAWLLSLLLLSGAVAAEPLRPFVSGSLQQIVGAQRGKPFLLAFWSLDCSHCQDELRMFGKAAQQARLPLVLVAVDTAAQQAEIGARLRKYGLDKQPAWVFADADSDKLRFEIDRRWYGELPRSYLYRADGSSETVSGKLDARRFAAWLQQIGVSENGERVDIALAGCLRCAAPRRRAPAPSRCVPPCSARCWHMGWHLPCCRRFPAGISLSWHSCRSGAFRSATRRLPRCCGCRLPGIACRQQSLLPSQPAPGQ